MVNGRSFRRVAEGFAASVDPTSRFERFSTGERAYPEGRRDRKGSSTTEIRWTVGWRRTMGPS
ncbi:hypothetical protein DMJ13_13930 [halophilic archaeon]|nr:hypothetical protein DMJ13_13930 [halophilic archaeon]